MRFLAIVVLAVLATGCGTLRSMTRKSDKPKPLSPLEDLSKVDDTHHGTTHAIRMIDE
jgi:uncharacterized protein YceK